MSGDGGPAFPVQPTTMDFAVAQARGESSGMNLRQYFAAKALEGFCGGGWRPTDNEARRSTARQAYAMADAMLEAESQVAPTSLVPHKAEHDRAMLLEALEALSCDHCNKRIGGSYVGCSRCGAARIAIAKVRGSRGTP